MLLVFQLYLSNKTLCVRLRKKNTDQWRKTLKIDNNGTQVGKNEKCFRWIFAIWTLNCIFVCLCLSGLIREWEIKTKRFWNSEQIWSKPEMFACRQIENKYTAKLTLILPSHLYIMWAIDHVNWLNYKLFAVYRNFMPHFWTFIDCIEIKTHASRASTHSKVQRNSCAKSFNKHRQWAYSISIRYTTTHTCYLMESFQSVVNLQYGWPLKEHKQIQCQKANCQSVITSRIFWFISHSIIFIEVCFQNWKNGEH